MPSLKFRGVQYVLSKMRKCTIVKVGEEKNKKNKQNTEKFISVTEIGEYALCIIGWGVGRFSESLQVIGKV